MADKKIYTIYDDHEVGSVVISDNVMCIIAGLAALEVDGIASMRGNMVASQITRSEMNKISKCVKIVEEDGKIKVQLALNIKYGYNLPDVTRKVQERVKDVLENMTGISVESVNISIADVQMQKQARVKKTEIKNSEEE
ncbi:MAG TPA: Asp23/Gls24 family envelope stress response protein [Candidatus Alectryocaccobium stercorigallinarum]|jgi:uncharacterized alkaline shock family protein YloU|nr:Asp23/Gls24 family envelope stress response protein [Candidatus Alectryocaccobium stercorigallinarum]